VRAAGIEAPGMLGIKRLLRTFERDKAP